MTARIVVAYPGGASAPAIRRLADERDAEVVTVTLDVGQPREVAEIRDRALSDGAARAHVLDVREEFARDHALPALKAGALPDITALPAPLIAAKLAEIGRIEEAAPEPVAAGAIPNLLCRPVADLAHAPEAAAQVELGFEGGVPSSINGVPMLLTELIESLSLIAGRHGVGRIGDLQAPAAVVLHEAFRALPGPDGLVRFSLFKGRHTVVAVEPAPRAVTQSAERLSGVPQGA
jgi:argininosuccinate synthase